MIEGVLINAALQHEQKDQMKHYYAYADHHCQIKRDDIQLVRISNGFAIYTRQGEHDPCTNTQLLPLAVFRTTNELLEYVEDWAKPLEVK